MSAVSDDPVRARRAHIARLAEKRGVPEGDLAAWCTLIDPRASDYLLDCPDFYACEGQVVAVGHVPGGGE